MAKIDSLNYVEDERMPPPPPATHGEGSGRKFFRPGIMHVFLLIIVLSGSATFYFYHQLSVLESDPQIQAQREIVNVMAQVSKIFLLPTGENPTVAVVNDPAKLKDQPFFVNAKKNDKVLIYVNAKEAILYDPSANKIINVAPIYFQSQNTTAAPSVLVPPVSTSSSPAKK